MNDKDAHSPEDSPRGESRAGSLRRWLPLSTAAAVAMLLVIGGSLWLANQDNRLGATSADSAGSAAATPRQLEVPVYYVGDTAAGPRLFREIRKVTADGITDTQAAVNAALGLPPPDPDYRLALANAPTATTRSTVDRIDIDLAQAPTNDLTQHRARIAVQALVFTVNAAGGTHLPVRFLVAGQPVEELLGIDLPEPVTEAGAEDTLAPVSVTDPVEGAQVHSGFPVTGNAATFEANVVWELLRGDTVVARGHTTAQECCRLAPYSFTVTAAPGQYTLVVHDTDESDGEGIGISQDTKDLTVLE